MTTPTDPLAALNPPWKVARGAFYAFPSLICDSRTRVVGGANDGAVARLMAAAPELAARLRRLVQDSRENDLQRNARDGFDDGCSWCCLVGCNPGCDVTQAENLLALLGVETKP
jgi:hypothetical protein